MTEERTYHYYFSTKALLLGTIVILGLTSVFSYLFIKTYQDDLLVGIIFLVPLVVILPVAMPDYIRFLFCAITSRPAVILSPDALVNNINGRTYKWNEIKEIKYKPFTGMNAPLGGYTTITLWNANKEVQIGHSSIRCRTTEFLQTLIRYHKQYSGG